MYTEQEQLEQTGKVDGTPPRSVRVISRLWVFSIFGILDGLAAMMRSSAGPSVILVGLGLWVLIGYVLAWLQELAWSVAFGPASDIRWGRRAWQKLKALGEDPGSYADRQRLAGMVGFVVFLLVALYLSFSILVHLQENRHGSSLIALTFLLAQLVALGVSVFVGASCKRAVFRFLTLIPGDTRARFLNTSIVLASSGIVALLGFALILMKTWTTVIAVDGLSWMFFLLAFSSQCLRWRVMPRRFHQDAPKARVLVLLAPWMALALVFAMSGDPQTRSAVFQDGLTSKYFLNKMQAWSDLDGDGYPFFPAMEDCGPLNSRRHPFATEIPGNGVDEDCDGLDVAQELYRVEKPDREPLKHVGRKPNIVLITVDALRADHLSMLDYKRDTSPNLAHYSEQGVVFEQAYSQDSGTGPSLWSLMVGKTPFQVALTNAKKFPPKIASSESTLAELLSRGGYRTEALLCGTLFESRQWNIRRGFRRYLQVCGKKRALQAPTVTKQALARLDYLKERGQPYFLWVHYFDPHAPYHNHKDLDLGDETIDFYDEEIQYTDREMAPLLEALLEPEEVDNPELGPPLVERKTYVLLGADHGENFGTHGDSPHARNLYREVTNVPFIVLGPDLVARHIKDPVALGDMFPTIHELAGLGFAEDTTMVSQVPVLFGADPDEERLVFQENSFSRPRRHAKAVLGRGHHLIMDITNGTAEYYDLEEDPTEQKNIYGRGGAKEKELERILRSFIKTTTIPKGLRR